MNRAGAGKEGMSVASGSANGSLHRRVGLVVVAPGAEGLELRQRFLLVRVFAVPVDRVVRRGLQAAHRRRIPGMQLVGFTEELGRILARRRVMRALDVCQRLITLGDLRR